MRANSVCRILLTIVSLVCINSTLYSQVSCVSPGSLQPGCAVNADLQDAVSASPIGACGGATSTTTYSIWYKFTAGATSQSITLAGVGSGSGASLTTTTTYIEAFSGNCGSLSAISVCQNVASPLNLTGLTVGTSYFIRIYVTANPSTNPAKRSFTITLSGPPSNDLCANAITLTAGTSCTNVGGTLAGATSSSPAITSTCTGTPGGDVWYSFVAPAAFPTISLSNTGSSLSSPYIQLLSGACGGFTSVACVNGTTFTPSTALTVGATYYIRVYTTTASPAGCNWTFDICVTYSPPPSNDECSNPIVLYSNTSCTNTSGTLAGATPSASIPLGCAAAGTYFDVWFSFVAASAVSETITFNTTGITNPRIQVYSGSCGSLVSISCSSTSPFTLSGLSVGTTYYIRVSNFGSTSTGTFNICITHPQPTIPSIDYSKSYVNLSRNAGGGTINPGDTLEIRATLVIKASGLDNLSFLDTLRLGGGVRLIPGSIALRTNEGVLYKSFTDANGDDAGHYYTSGTDTVVRINFGTGATATNGGTLTNSSKPAIYGPACIIMATYRVVVYAGYGLNIGLGGGKFMGSPSGGGPVNNLSFSPRSAMVYSSPGLCPNSVAASNAIGGDFNGTFGSGSSQNRGPSSNVTGYTFATFTANAPGDYYYGVANNTSPNGAGFSTITTWPKSDATHRVFGLWDITGDHTGASNTAKGNKPCDPSQPISATNPCGYMLVVNSAYKADTAFQYTVSNLCPNSYYEISAWLKNICYKCGYDSNGVAATATGYIPSGPNDSSGVQPNLTFDINGVDYYTTGNIKYNGLFPSTQSGSDSNNTWVKRGFTYLTGPSQTSFTLTIRNNAPGGGGNDWAMDDIALATCLPNMQYSPTLNPYTCTGNDLLVRDTIRSYFNNYANYKWQRSTDGGLTWSDVSTSASATPVWNGSAYEFVTSYTIPPTNTNASDSGNKYRVIVATTSGNLANTDCQVTDGVSQITLSVGSNCFPLAGYLLTFNGKVVNGQGNLFWTTNKENEPVQFEIEKSIDGINFIKIGTVRGLKSANETNYYSFTDTALSAKSFYRISLVNAVGRKNYSRIIQLQISNQFLVSNVTSYFQSGISLDVNVNTNSKVELALMNSSGSPVKSMALKAYSGTNNFIIPDLDYLAPGVYILQVRNGEKTATIKTIKK